MKEKVENINSVKKSFQETERILAQIKPRSHSEAMRYEERLSTLKKDFEKPENLGLSEINAIQMEATALSDTLQATVSTGKLAQTPERNWVERQKIAPQILAGDQKTLLAHYHTAQKNVETQFFTMDRIEASGQQIIRNFEEAVKDLREESSEEAKKGLSKRLSRGTIEELSEEELTQLTNRIFRKPIELFNKKLTSTEALKEEFKERKVAFENAKSPQEKRDCLENINDLLLATEIALNKNNQVVPSAFQKLINAAKQEILSFYTMTKDILEKDELENSLFFVLKDTVTEKNYKSYQRKVAEWPPGGKEVEAIKSVLLEKIFPDFERHAAKAQEARKSMNEAIGAFEEKEQVFKTKICERIDALEKKRDELAIAAKTDGSDRAIERYQAMDSLVKTLTEKTTTHFDKPVTERMKMQADFQSECSDAIKIAGETLQQHQSDWKEGIRKLSTSNEEGIFSIFNFSTKSAQLLEETNKTFQDAPKPSASTHYGPR